MKKLYVVYDGILTIVILLEESIVEGAIIPTYLVQHSDGTKTRVSKYYYFESRDEAIKDYKDFLLNQVSFYLSESQKLIGLGNDWLGKYEEFCKNENCN